MALTPLYPVTDHPLLGQKFISLKTEEAQVQENIRAEMLLGLKGPAYTGDDKDRLKLAVVHQINFQLEQGLTPEIHRSVTNNVPGASTAYRNRIVSPEAWKIISDVTGVQTIGFRPPGIGV